MKRTKHHILWLAVFLAVSSIQVFGKPFAEGPYLGQIPPGPIAQVFAPGLICNTGQRTWEAFGIFSADGNTFCFQRVSGIFITENTDRESHRTRNTFSSTAAMAGIQGSTAYIRISTGLNSRNIYPNPTDNLNQYQASEKEICYEADGE